MNKEIKFRAWDSLNSESNNGKMHYFNSMQVCDNGLWFNNDDFDLGENHCDDEDAVVMRYTGLKDNSNKPIYEGDLLQNENYIGLVIFSKGCFCLEIKRRLKKDLSPFTWCYDIEQTPALFEFEGLRIIGNIYETPEKLNAGSNAV